MPILVTLAVLTAIAVMTHRGVKGAVLWGILGGTLLYYLLGLYDSGVYTGFGATLNLNPFAAFQEFGTSAFGMVFTEGFDLFPLSGRPQPRRAGDPDWDQRPWPSAWWICSTPSAPCMALAPGQSADPGG